MWPVPKPSDPNRAKPTPGPPDSAPVPDRIAVTPKDISRLMPSQVTVRAPGKVNLSLRVGGLDDQGYHPLINVFQAVSAWEEVTATPRPDNAISLSVQGPGSRFVPLNETNLVAKAARALQQHTETDLGANLAIIKGVPVAGGMAGGSADAAATLVALNALWRLGLTAAELLEIGATLGADVPFCLFGGTAVGLGRGEQLTALESTGQFHWVFALRAKGLSTPAVFSRFDSMHPAGKALDDQANAGLYAALAAGDPAALAGHLHNDLHDPALAMAPDLQLTMEAARAAGGLRAMVSGSGPTLAVLCASRQDAERIKEELVTQEVCADALVASGAVRGAHIV